MVQWIPVNYIANLSALITQLTIIYNKQEYFIDIIPLEYIVMVVDSEKICLQTALVYIYYNTHAHWNHFYRCKLVCI